MLSGKPFSGKGIIITGGGSGLGLQMAKTLGSYGAAIHIMSRDLEKLDRAKNMLKENSIESMLNCAAPWINSPPSILMVSPLMNSAASLMRYAASSPISLCGSISNR